MTHWADFVSLVSETLCSAGSEVLVPKEGTPLPGHTATVALNYKLRLSAGYFGGLVHRDQQMKRGVPTWTRIIDLHQQEEVGVLSHKGAGRDPGDPLGCFLLLPCSTATVNRHVQPLQTEEGMMIRI